jgi:hypothetical protein
MWDINLLEPKNSVNHGFNIDDVFVKLGVVMGTSVTGD